MQHERGMTVLQVVSNIVARRSYAMQQSCRATKQGSPIVALLMLGWRSQAHIGERRGVKEMQVLKHVMLMTRALRLMDELRAKESV